MYTITEKEHKRLVRMSGASAYLTDVISDELSKKFPDMTLVELASVLSTLSSDMLRLEMKEEKGKKG